MSQEKVEHKKELKKNRKKIVRKKKIEYVCAIAAVCIIAVGIIGWFGYSAYDKISENIAASKGVEYQTLDAKAISDYIGTLN